MSPERSSVWSPIRRVSTEDAAYPLCPLAEVPQSASSPISDAKSPATSPVLLSVTQKHTYSNDINNYTMLKNKTDREFTTNTYTISKNNDLTNLSWLHEGDILKGRNFSVLQSLPLDTDYSSTSFVAKSTNDINDPLSSLVINDDPNSCEASLLSTSSTSIASFISNSCDNIESTSNSFSAPFLSIPPSPSVPPEEITSSNLTNSVTEKKKFHNEFPACRSFHLPHYDPMLDIDRKPPCSFSILIYMALNDSDQRALPVKDIYNWITMHFPYFLTTPEGWKNSVRHNLSLNRWFKKLDKSTRLGKGSLWKIDESYHLKSQHNKGLTRSQLQYRHYNKPHRKVSNQSKSKSGNLNHYQFLLNNISDKMTKPSEMDRSSPNTADICDKNSSRNCATANLQQVQNEDLDTETQSLQLQMPSPTVQDDDVLSAANTMMNLKNDEDYLNDSGSSVADDHDDNKSTQIELSFNEEPKYVKAFEQYHIEHQINVTVEEKNVEFGAVMGLLLLSGHVTLNTSIANKKSSNETPRMKLLNLGYYASIEAAERLEREDQEDEGESNNTPKQKKRKKKTFNKDNTINNGDNKPENGETFLPRLLRSSKKRLNDKIEPESGTQSCSTSDCNWARNRKQLKLEITQL